MAMYPKTAATDISQFGTPTSADLSFGTPVSNKAATVSQASAAKAGAVQEKSLFKQAVYGSPEEQNRIATAILQDNELAQSQDAQDLFLPPDQLAQKYGAQAALDRANFAETYFNLRELKNEKRSTGEMLKDSAIDTGLAAANMVGGAGVLGLTAVDIATQNDNPMSVQAAEALGALNAYGQSNQSELMQQRRMQHALEGQLDQEDSAAQYQRDLDASAGGETDWERSTKPWIKKQGRDFADAVTNYADDPIMAGSLVPEAVGSILPVTGAARVAGKLGAMSQLTRQGMSKKAATEFLKTKPGKALMEKEATKIAPFMVGLTEGGSAISQTQQEIMGMTEEDLAGTEIYDGLRAEGKSHEEAKQKLALNSGAVAGAAALPLALGAGKISAPFVANPLKAVTARKGVGSTVASGAKNVVKEGIEETIQEGNSQLASNIGQSTAGGLDVALDEGVAGSAAEGLLGGVASAGALQSPGVVAGTAKEVGNAAAAGASKAFEERKAQVDRSIDASNPAGETARKETATEATQAAESIMTAPTKVAPKIKELVETATYLPADEAAQSAEMFPSIKAKLEADPAARIEHADAFEAVAQVVMDPKAEDAAKLPFAVSLMQTLNSMRSIESTELDEQIAALPDDDQTKMAHAKLVARIATLNSSPAAQKATKIVEGMTVEDTAMFIPFDEIKSGAATEQDIESYKSLLTVIGSINPVAASTSQYDIILNQVKPGAAQDVVKSFRDVAALFEKATKEKKKIFEDRDSVIESFDPENKQREQKTSAQQDKDTQSRLNIASVSEDIAESGNRNNKLPSLSEHRRNFSEAVGTGRTLEALDHLTDLGEFATAQLNKIAAYNASAKAGKREAVPFESRNASGKFMDDAGVFIDTASPSSVSLALEAWVDASTLVGLYNAQLQDPRLKGKAQSLKPMEMPVLDPTITSAGSALPSSNAPPVQDPSDGTSSDSRDQSTVPKKQGKKVRKAAKKQAARAKKAEVQALRDAEEAEAVRKKAAVRPTVKPVDPELDVTDDLEDEDTAADVADAVPSKTWLNGMKDYLFAGKDGFNRFLDSYKPSNNGSTFTSNEDPMTALIAGIDSLVTDENGMERPLTDEEKDALNNLARFIPKLSGWFTHRLKRAIHRKYPDSEEDTRSWAQRLEAGSSEPMSYPNSYPLNFTMIDGVEGEIEQRVMQATLMAVFQWMAKDLSNGRVVMRDRDITDMFGKIRGSYITKEMRTFSETGMSYQAAMTEITRTIEDLLGVSPDGSKSASHTQGILRTMAINGMDLLIGKGAGRVVLNEKTVETVVDGKNSFKTLYTLRTEKEEDGDEVLTNLRTMPDVFTRIFTKGVEKARYVGEAPKGVSRTQIRNKYGKLSRGELKVQGRLQEQAFTFNMPMLDLAEELGDDVYMDLVGRKQTEGVASNPEHLARVESKNRSIEAGLEGLRTYQKDAEIFAAQEDNEYGSFKDVPVFFDWKISKVGRLQQQGSVTPQGNKSFREMVAATNSTVDLTDPAQVEILQLAVAQSLDIGIEGMDRATAIEKSRKMLGDPNGLAPALNMLKDRYVSGKPLDVAKFKASLEAANDIEVTDKLLHALVTTARVAQARTEGGTAASEFKTALSIEADGKTDGPINAIIHMSLNEFTEDDIARFAKGGLFFSGSPVSLNDYQKLDPDDLYTKAAGIFEENLSELFSSVSGEDKTKMSSLLKVLGGLLDGFNVTDLEGELDFEVLRKVTKNPLTVFLYGSGLRGISQKVTDAVLTKMYGALDDLAKGMESGKYTSWRDHPVLGKEGVMTSLRDLVTTNIRSSEAQSIYTLLKDPTSDAVLNEKSIDAFTDAVEEFFGEPLGEAIDEASGGLAKNMKAVQEISNIQSSIFQDAFNKLLKQRTAEKAATPNARKGELLSENEMRDIFEETLKVAPVYSTDMQEFFISTGTSYESDKRVAESFTGRKQTGAVMPEPSDAGVKVSPYMTIGTGDGRMMLNVYLDGDGALDASLAVFDGVEQSVSNAVAGSTQINKAALDGWLNGNIYASVSKSFDEMMSYTTDSVFESLDSETFGKLSRTLQLKKGEMLTRDMLVAKATALRRMVESSAARKAAMKRMNMSVEHMAYLGLPHMHEGEVVEDSKPNDYVAIADKLNTLYQEELAKIRTKQDVIDTAETVAGPDPEMMAAVQAAGTAVDGQPNVMSLTGDKVVKLLGRTAGPFRDLLKASDDVMSSTYFFGTSEDLSRLPGKTGAPVQLGQADIGQNVVYIANTSPETVLHEMLHTLTAKTLVDHYDNPNDSPQHVKDAVGRLELLMKEMRAMQLDVSTKGTSNEVIESAPVMTGTAQARALATLQAELQANEGNPAVQMTEFLSWNLSNQNLMGLTKERKVRSRLLRISYKVLDGLRTLLGLEKLGPGNTLFTNIRFNTQILAAKSVAKVVAEGDAKTNLILDQVFGQDARLQRVEQRFLKGLSGKLNADKAAAKDAASQSVQTLEVAKLQKTTQEAAEYVIHKGFTLSLREAQAFKAVHSAMTSGMTLETTALGKANKLYRHAISKLTAEDFLRAEGIDPAKAGALDEALAAQRLDVLVGAGGMRKAANGNTDLIATFMALAQTSPVMRTALENLPAPVSKIEVGSTGNALTRIINSVIAYLTEAADKRRRLPKSTVGRLDILATTLSEVEGDRRFIASYLDLVSLDRANDYVSSAVEKGSDAVTAKLRALRERKALQGSSNKVTGAIAAAELVTSLGSKTSAAAAGESLTKMANHANGLNTVRSLLSDLRGMTESNAPLLRLINVVKAEIDAIRQDFREKIPDQLADRFSRKLEKNEWSQLFQTLGKADITALGRETAADLMLDPSKAKQLIQTEEETLGRLGGKHAAKYRGKSKALAEYMMTSRIVSVNLLRNANAIAHLFGEENLSEDQVSEELKTSIDRLTSLYAYELVDTKSKASLKELMETEAEGMKTLTGYHASTRALEKQNKMTTIGRNNGWKGYVPSTPQEGASVVVADNAEHGSLIRRGYVRMGKYEGSRTEGYSGTRSYYQSTVSGRNAFRQGVAQTVHATYQGVDARTGITKSGEMAGIVSGNSRSGAARRFRGQLSSGNNIDRVKAANHLLPIYGEDGQLMGFERPMEASALTSLNKDTHLGRMLGVWSGRILEEGEADKFNASLVSTLKDIYEDQKGDRGDEFVNVADPDNTDPVIADAWNTMGQQIKEDAEAIFGQKDYLPIRKDMIADALGYRAAGVKDPWTGVTRWSDESQKRMVDFATFVMGKDAFKRLAQGESIVNDAVSYAKTTIIIRSVVVTLANLVSNTHHLMMHGINPVTGTKAMKDKFTEITQYVKNRDEISNLHLSLAADINDPKKVVKLKASIRALEDANRSMSIAPLIASGEFSTVSENLTEADVAAREGRVAEFFERAVDKLPEFAKTAGKNVLITKDTALFQGLNRMVQYGDFVAKAVLYDHLIQKKGMVKQEALDVIAEEFVNYNRLSGRGRDYLESIGLVWFYNYKLRITKIAMKMIREKPASALLYGAGVGPFTGIDTVMSAALPSSIVSGRYSYSLGWEMGLNAPTLMPWNNLIN